MTPVRLNCFERFEGECNDELTEVDDLDLHDYAEVKDVTDDNIINRLSSHRRPEQPLANACPDMWSWSSTQKSHEVRLSGPDNRVVLFHPNWSNGSAGVRGRRRLNGDVAEGCSQKFYWEINVSHRIFGTSMMFGVGSDRSRLHVDSFVNLIGEDSQSWGLSHKGHLWHNGRIVDAKFTQPFLENLPTAIGMLYENRLEGGSLTYFKDGNCLGTAFTNIDAGFENTSSRSETSIPIYPMISSTAAKTQMSLGVTKREFTSLRDRCRQTILNNLLLPSSQNHSFQRNMYHFSMESLKGKLPSQLFRYVCSNLEHVTYNTTTLISNNFTSFC